MPIVMPHPPLTRYYGAASGRDAFVRRLFDDSAALYDRINAVFSLGTGGWYRRRALQQAGLQPGQQALDVAAGTGLVAREAARVLGTTRGLVGLDLSPEMIRAARRSLAIPFLCGRAEALPVADASFDFLSMGYALRHVGDLTTTFTEYRRVLRPGGRLLLLEIARPEGRLAYAAARFYLGRVVPAISAGLGGGRPAQLLMRYYWDTIDTCVPPSAILDGLAQAGFEHPRCDVQFGIFRAYMARKPDR